MKRLLSLSLALCLLLSCGIGLAPAPAQLPLSGVGGSGFTPKKIAGLFAWYSADSGLYQDAAKTTQAKANNDPVGCWSDLSGNGFDLTQATAANKPLLQTTFINGRSAVLGNGTSTSLAVSFSSKAQPYTVFIVWRSHTISPYVVDCHSINTGVIRSENSSGNKFSVFVNPTDLVGPAFSIDTWYIETAIFNGASSSIQVNNGAPTSGTTGATGRDGITLFARGDGAFAWLNGYVAEALFYTGSLSAPNQAKVVTYLNGRYRVF